MSTIQKQPKNILFILTDDQGAWAMHCAGNDDIHTPNLDRLAAEQLIGKPKIRHIRSSCRTVHRKETKTGGRNVVKL